MDYSDYTREQLLQHIEDLELLNRELMQVSRQKIKLEYAWTGNLGHWFWNIRSDEVTFNPLKVTTLGYEEQEIPAHVSHEFFTSKLHYDDYQNTMQTMKDHLSGKTSVYEVEYRIQKKDGSYRWYFDLGKITEYDGDGKPLFIAGIVFDITEKKAIQLELQVKNEMLAKMSATDGLTNISNYRSLIEHLGLAMQDVKNTNIPLSIAIFDIDDFKKVNDSKGHIAGDQALIDVASIIGAHIRSTDRVGRYGGEEFMVLFPNTELAIAKQMAEEIRQAIESHAFGEGVRLTLSGGVKQYAGEPMNEFINQADKHLYLAKAMGKNQIAT